MRLIDADKLIENKFANDISYNAFRNLVNRQPTVQKVGWWMTIERGEQGYSAGDFRCSVCGKPNKCYSLTDYCANCGASMKRKEESNND